MNGLGKRTINKERKTNGLKFIFKNSRILSTDSRNFNSESTKILDLVP